MQGTTGAQFLYWLSFLSGYRGSSEINNQRVCIVLEYFFLDEIMGIGELRNLVPRDLV
jgi:hypothetical protein